MTAAAAPVLLSRLGDLHETLLAAGIAFMHDDPATAAGALDDLAIAAHDLAADLREPEGKRA